MYRILSFTVGGGGKRLLAVRLATTRPTVAAANPRPLSHDTVVIDVPPSEFKRRDPTSTPKGKNARQ